MQKSQQIRQLLTERLAQGEATTEELAELIRPYYEFDLKHIIDMELKRRVRKVMSGFRDEEGTRICFSDNKGSYVNVETAGDIVKLTEIQAQLDKKYVGLNSSRKKVSYRRKVVLEQMSIFDMVEIHG